MANPKQINANYRKTERLLEQNPTPVDLGVSETVADYVAEEISDLAKDDFSNVNYGSENEGKSLMVDSNGGIEVGNPSFTPGTSGVVVPDTPATTHDAVNQLYVDTLDAQNVKLTGNQTITGYKKVLGRLMAKESQLNGKHWTKLYTVDTLSTRPYEWSAAVFLVTCNKRYLPNTFGLIRFAMSGTVDGTIEFVTDNAGFELADYLCVVRKADGSGEIWGNTSNSNALLQFIVLYENYNEYLNVDGVTIDDDFDPTDTTKYANYQYLKLNAIVPDIPETTHSAVNQAYVESTVDGVNNLVHKSGNEIVAGLKLTSGVYNKLAELPANSDSTKWSKIYSADVRDTSTMVAFIDIHARNFNDCGKMQIWWQSNAIGVNWIYAGEGTSNSYKFVLKDGVVELWHKSLGAYRGSTYTVEMVSRNGTLADPIYVTPEVASWVDEPDWTTYDIIGQENVLVLRTS